MESSALIPSQTGPVFSQQGTVDWTQLAKSTVTLSFEILSRLSQAGVEPLTLAVGQAIFSRFPIPPSTQRKIQDILENLKPFSSYSNILWFGFGVKHVVRLLVESEQGVICVALCGGLSVSYDKFYCAQVLRSMTQIQETPTVLSPSITQWSNLVGVCSGTLLSSHFPNIVEGFSRLWYNGEDQDAWKRRGATPPNALAKALSTLAAVASGTLQSATFVGGADCAWIAAVAEWVLCLTIEISDAKTGNCLYQKLGNTQYETAQVMILRTFDAQDSMVRVRDTTCFLPSSAEIFHVSTGMGVNLFAGGRSTWDSILSDTFPVDSLHLLALSEAGSAFAHILYKVADDLNSEFGENKNVLGILPELTPILSNIVPDNNGDFIHAERIIRAACGCHRCKNIFWFPAVCPQPGVICIHRIAATILEYLWILAHVHLHENIQPSSSGLRQLYFLSSGELGYPRIENISQNRKNNVLEKILLAMTGIPVQENLSLDASAASESGMSICCASLLNPNLPPRGRAAFHLIPGQIQKDGAFFKEVYDLDPKLGTRLEEDSLMPFTFDQKLRLMTSFRQNQSAPELLVKETTQYQKLQANYSWQYQLINSQLQEKHPTLGTSTPSTKVLVTAFGSAELQRLLFQSVSVPCCNSREVVVTTRGNRLVRGTCYSVTEDILMQIGSPPSGHLPRVGEWVLLDVGIQKEPDGYAGEEFPTKLYTGSFFELYSLLCNSEPGKRLKLVCALSCLFCTCLWKARTIIVVPGQTSPSEIVFADGITVLEPDDQKTENRNAESSLANIHWDDAGVVDIEGNSTAPEPLPPQEAKSKKRKSSNSTRGGRKRRK